MDGRAEMLVREEFSGFATSLADFVGDEENEVSLAQVVDR